MAFLTIDTDLIILGGRTVMSRMLVKVAKKDTFGLGKCDAEWDDLYKALLITRALELDNDYTEEEIQCLESELLNEIQSPENLQAVQRVPQTIFPPLPPSEGPIKI